MSRSPMVESIVAVPGNPGIASLDRAECRALPDPSPTRLAQFASAEKIDLTVVGPEEPLVNGIADIFARRGLRIFGPRADCARLEGSKTFAKEVMDQMGIPTARSATFAGAEEAPDARRWLSAREGPWVVKADGLAAGKGVLVSESIGEAHAWVDDCLAGSRFGAAGSSVVVEEFLDGPELSLLVLTDGKTILPLAPARDHKRLLDNDEGPNTGGMGAYSPVPGADEDLIDQILDTIVEPTLAGLDREGARFTGVLYAGLVLTEEGPKVLEFNVRFGDPEAQAVIPRLESDLAEHFIACTEGRLAQEKLEWRQGACVSVVASADGYPENPQKGDVIDGLDGGAGDADADAVVFQAGTATAEDGSTVTAGGRVLAVSGLGEDISAARERAYGRLNDLNFRGMHYRRDIGMVTT